MPARNVFARSLILAVLACGSLPVPSHAADASGARPSGRWQPADRDEERAVTRDLRPTPAKPDNAGIRPRVTLRPSSTVVAVGEPIKFGVASDVDGFGHIYVVSASGRVQVWMENVPIAADRHIRFPSGGLRINAAPPAGYEDVVLVVTRNRIDGFLGRGPTRTPRDLAYPADDFKEAVREKFEDLPRRDWGYARTLVRVIDRGVSEDIWGWNSKEWR